VASLGALAIAALCFGPTLQDQVLYNHSPSIPVGFYWRSEAPSEPGAIVTVRAADVAGDYARLRGFAGPGDRFIKRVAGGAGDVVCANGGAVTLNGELLATRREVDSEGRRLPNWSGCHTLGEHQLLLMGTAPDSFDGRYWGIVSRNVIEGVWRPLSINQP
jgi:conjugative transfer signal peptidase TraF